MSAPETPREKAIRLWEAAGYVAEAVSRVAAHAAEDAYAASVRASEKAKMAKIDLGTYERSYNAGIARYKKEHP